MPCPVRWMKRSPYPRLDQGRPGRGVDVLAGGAHGRGGHGGALGGLEGGVGLGDLRRRSPDRHAAGDVGAVPGARRRGPRAPEVAQHHLAPFDHRRSRVVVGAGGVRARGDDGEVDPGVALGEQTAPDVGRHLGLGPTDQGDVAGLELGRDAVGGRGRVGQGGDLLRVLPGPERSDDLRGPPPPEPVAELGLQVEHEPGPRAVAHRRHARGGADQTRDHRDRIGGLRPRCDGEDVRPLDHPGRLQLGDDEHRLASRGTTSMVRRSSGIAS